jgi:hypothetical protein
MYSKKSLKCTTMYSLSNGNLYFVTDRDTIDIMKVETKKILTKIKVPEYDIKNILLVDNFVIIGCEKYLFQY